MEEDLRQALVDGDLTLGYQPIVHTANGQLVAAEALLRWTHPEHGPIPPLIVIGLAEQSDLIDEIGAWVLQQSGRDRAGWTLQSPDSPIDLAVNVSGRQLVSHNFCAVVANMLAATHMDPNALILEITESMLVEDSERAATVLHDLKALGVRLALDDFGTGFSSLSYLRRMPVDVIKLDRSFVTDTAEGSQGTAIATAVTALAHVLGLTVVAEGVETQSQRDQVAAMGCDSSQGFYYAEAMSASALATELADRPREPLRAVPVQRSRPAVQDEVLRPPL